MVFLVGPMNLVDLFAIIPFFLDLIIGGLQVSRITFLFLCPPTAPSDSHGYWQFGLQCGSLQSYSHIASASSLLLIADFHGQWATLVTPDNLMYSLPTILPCHYIALLRAI
jgi:hypothetical protein